MRYGVCCKLYRGEALGPDGERREPERVVWLTAKGEWVEDSEQAEAFSERGQALERHAKVAGKNPCEGFSGTPVVAGIRGSVR